MTNITKVFNPPPSRDLTDEEVENCVVCQTMATVMAITAGGYFASGQIFKGQKDLEKNPIWWRNFIKGTGYGLIGYGIFRGTEGWLWNVKKEPKLN